MLLTIGDMIVVLINIAERNNITIEDCLEQAWNDIKDRKGKMIDGIFVKEGDYNGINFNYRNFDWLVNAKI